MYPICSFLADSMDKINPARVRAIELEMQANYSHESKDFLAAAQAWAEAGDSEMAQSLRNMAKAYAVLEKNGGLSEE